MPRDSQITTFQDGQNILFDETFMRTVPKAVPVPNFPAVALSKVSYQGNSILGISGNRAIYVPNFQENKQILTPEFVEIKDTILWGTWTVVLGKQAGDDRFKIHVFKPNSAGSTFEVNETQIPLSNITSDPAIFSIFGNFLILCNGNQVMWSDAGNVERWQAPTRNIIVSRELHGSIEAIEELRGQSYIYTQERIFALTFVGGTLQFALTPALNAGGAQGSESIISVGNKHYGYSSDGFFVSTGFEYQLLDDVRIRGEFTDTPTAAVHREATNEVIWYFGSKAAVYNYKFGTWSIMQYASPVNGAVRIDKPYIFIGTTMQSEGRDGSDWNATTSGIDCGRRDRFKSLQAVEVICDGNAEIKIEVSIDGAGTNYDTIYDSTNPENLSLDSGSNFIYTPKRDAMHIKVTFSGTQDFRLESLNFWGFLSGVYKR